MIGSINLFDILFIILLVGMVYKGSRVGVGDQIVPFVGLFVLIFISITFYSVLSQTVFSFLLQKWARPVSFLAIFGLYYLAMKLLEKISHISGGGELSTMEWVAGSIMAFLRTCLLFGLIGLQLLLIPVDYVRHSIVKNSRVCMGFIKIDSRIYEIIVRRMGKPGENLKGKIKNEFLDFEE